MTADDIRTILSQRGAVFTEKATQNGRRFDCKTGEIFNVFDSGKMSFQGKQDTALAREIKALHGGAGDAAAPAEVAAAPVNTGAPAIFVVYGHDTAARDQLELHLRRMGFEPIILANLPA